MEVLKEALNRGVKFEIHGDKLRVVAIHPIPVNLVEKIKANKQDIVQVLKRQSKPDQYKSKPQAKIIDSGLSHESRRYFTGYNPPRYVHIDVCKWHVEEGDPACMNCKHLDTKDKELFMDAYLNKAIARLNEFYQPGDKIDWDKAGAREQIRSLEKSITEAFLEGNIGAYIKAIDKWEATFKDMRRRCSK